MFATRYLSTRVLLIISLLFSCAYAYSIENNPYRSDLLWVTTPDHHNWIYQVGEEAKVTVAIYRYGVLQDGLTIEFEIGPDMLPSDTKGTAKLKEGETKIAIGSMTKPGFRDLRLAVEIDGNTYKHHIKVGFSPHELKAYTTLPNDFADFWQDEISKAEKVPLKAERNYEPSCSSNAIDCYLVKLQVYKPGQFIYGYLSMPKKDGKYPAVLSPPGAGIKPMSPHKDLFYAESGIIRFDMEIHGIRPDLEKSRYNEINRAFNTNNTSYLVNGLDNKNNYYMKKAYLAPQAVATYLTSLPEWDGKNLIAQGGSQGGALALIATALDKRITLVAANHPALSDMAGYKAGRAGGYPHLFTKFSGMDTPEKLETLAYYDVVNFARMIDVPVFMTWGFNDNTCPPTTSYIVYNSISAKKEALITPANEHWISTNTRHQILEWIKRKIK